MKNERTYIQFSVRRFVLAALLLSTTSAFTQTIPSGLLTDWNDPGYRGDFGANVAETDVTAFGLVGDSITDNTTALNALINAAAGTRAILYFPAGAYLFRGTIQLRDSIILKGENRNNSRLVFNFNGAAGNCINLSGGANQSWFPVNDGHTRGNQWLTVNDGGVLQPADWAEIRQVNGTWDTQPISWADYSVGQLLEITARSGDTLFFSKPLRIAFSDSLNVEISRFNPVREVGVECLSVQRADSASCFCPTINAYHAIDCWVRGVEGKKSISAHVLLDRCSNVSVTGSYFHDAYEYNGSSMHGYGLAIYYHTGQCLVENNIFRRLRHSISFQCGANGNVVAYNYSREPNRSEFPANYGADISMHGHYSFANLFESNIVQNIQLDQTWGPNGPGNTYFRNRAELYGILMSSGTVNSDSQLFVGNEVTSTAAFQGNYTLAGTGHFQHGNWIRGTMTPTGTSSLPESSLYLSGAPVFWPAGSIWPSIGTPNASNSGSIPARDRYLANSELTVCEDGSPSTSVSNVSRPGFIYYPNPAFDRLYLQLPSGIEKAELTVSDLSGRKIIQQCITQNQEMIDVSSLHAGWYSICIETPSGSQSQKLIIQR